MQRKIEPLRNLMSNLGLFVFSITLFILAFLTRTFSAYGGVVNQERLLPAGSYLPFFQSRAIVGKLKAEALRNRIPVRSFWLDTHPVTNQEYLNFVRFHPDWRRSKIARVFADNSYLKYWLGDLSLHSFSNRNQPVTQVSWFAASAFCHSQGKELPTTDQWEYAAEDAGKNPDEIKNRILNWYSVPNRKVLRSVKKELPNSYGIYDLHGLIWEWTLDFNSEMTSSELRSDGTKDDNLFCGAGSLNSLNPSDYAKFMRYSFRSSLRADYTTANLGFRCARGEMK